MHAVDVLDAVHI